MNVLIINGSGSIGSELVKMGNSLDHNIFYTSNRAEDGNNHSCINWNYSGSKSVSNLFEKLKDKCSQIDAVANCLGSIFLKPAHLTSEKDLDETLDINLKSSFFILKESIPLMRKNGGNILFFSSAAARIGLANHEAIAAAKSGLEGLVRSAAATYAKNNIRINAIGLGLVESNLSKSMISNPISLEMSKKMHSLGRIGTPKSVVRMASQILYDNESWITGSTISIDGGLSTTKLAS
tara:strand:- start:1 stop:711 length:711 start_codon:yes stop_codon:yes gene_type:complete